MLFPTSPRKLSLLAFPLLLGTWLPLLWSLRFPSNAPAPIPFLSRQDAALAHLDSLQPHDLVIYIDGSVPFHFCNGASVVLAN